MIELLLQLPNICAQFACMVDQAYYANLLYTVGYLPFIHRNYKKGDMFHLRYFAFLWTMSIAGVVMHLMGWSLLDLFS